MRDISSLKSLASLALICSIAVPPLPAQSAPPQPVSADKTSTIRFTTREVLIDFVVRDKRERLVSDLKAEDVEVYEDGVKQTPRAFRAVTGREQIEYEEKAKAAVAEGKSVALNPLREINLVSIIFGMMSPHSRELAHDAVSSFLKNQMSPNTFGAVYSLAYKLNALQMYTTKIDELQKATDRASLGTYSQYAKDNENVLNQLQSAVGIGIQLSAGANGATTASGTIQTTNAFDPMTASGMSTAGADLAFGDAARFQAKALADQRFLAADSEGVRTIEALQAFVQRQSMLPGRKTVLYLTEGLPVPPERPELLQALIAHANTSNVSFYLMDVRGLTTTSSTSAAASELRNRAALSGPVSGGTENVAVGLSGGDQKESVHVDDSLLLSTHGDNQLTMRELAEGTGGFLVANTNQIVKPMQRVMEDVRTHYEIAYSPISTNFDGHFRKVEVRVHRTGVKIQSRTGYYALPDLNGDSTQSYEVAGMKVLDTKPLPNAVKFSADALDFGSMGSAVQCVVAFQVPKNALTATEDKEKKVSRLRASLFALVKDDKGQIVGKAGKDFGIEVPSEKAATLLEGDLLYSQPVELRPGHYTLETVVLDREGDKAGVRRVSFEVPKPEALGLSAISVVRRIDPLHGDRDQFDPLQYSGGKVVPSLSQRVKGGSNTGFYFVFYPLLKADGKPNLDVKPEVTVSFYLDGKEIANGDPQIPLTADATAIPVMLSAKFNPGEYMMKVTVKHGERSVERSTAFQVF